MVSQLKIMLWIIPGYVFCVMTFVVDTVSQAHCFPSLQEDQTAKDYYFDSYAHFGKQDFYGLALWHRLMDVYLCLNSILYKPSQPDVCRNS